MKKILSLLILLLFGVSFTGCMPTTQETPTEDQKTEVKEKSTPTFFGGDDMELSIKTGSVFNPLRGISAMANGVDITDLIIYNIYDVNNNNEEIFEISLSSGGTYKIVYLIPNSANYYSATKERIVVVGSGYSDFVYDINNLTYKLVFEENFDGTVLDTSVWNYETGTGSGGWGNNEAQYYTNSTKNVYVENGYLNIKAIKENKGGCSYTSARITTQNKVDVKYGRIEASIKMPSGRGIWPAFWMMPTKSVYGGWPNSGEIDIMEHVGYNPNVIHSTVHNKLYNGMNGQQKGSSRSISNIYSEYHTYAVEWLPDKMLFYCDNIKIFEYAPSKRTADNWPYDQEFFMILNVAVGGNWGGAQGIDNSIFPQTMSVDYIRIYQAEELEKYK